VLNQKKLHAMGLKLSETYFDWFPQKLDQSLNWLSKR